jgi:hypothetical protein
VLGAVVSEIADGTKQRTLIHAAGSVMAIQNGPTASPVTWENYDASGASYRQTDTQGQSVAAAELDPVGANAGTMKPITWNQPSSPGKLEPQSSYQSNESGC